ncbi:MAG: aminodeoxychorismate/anthranilate synthase component II [Lachnospiraceae bacterium]|nr:aminodeoxychorismate/anthranilate synthase component II [Lachnospiraceae bacterium]
MILIIDNYDSFSYNLYQYIGELASDVKVVRNDELSCRQIEALRPTHLILSPGPGRPADAGICEEAIRFFEGKLPILGVCLGHQAICEAYGAKITYAPKLMHGKQSLVFINHNPWGDANIRQIPASERKAANESDMGDRGISGSDLFKGIGDSMTVARYHSLIADEDGFPKELLVTARTADGEIMAVCHAKHPTYGLQFHPESILTPEGKVLIQNFLVTI